VTARVLLSDRGARFAGVRDMAQLVHEHRAVIRTPSGAIYVARTYAEQLPHGVWIGWLEFTPASGGPTLRTDFETSQPTLEMVAYWASGLEPVYFEGAFERAHVIAAT
jgi:hypothetical protein